MAHFILEYSDNIPAEDLALQDLFKKLHSTAEASGLFPLKGIRSRAHGCSDFRLADGNPRHMFVHLNVLLGAGRSMQDRERVAEEFFDVLTNHFSNNCVRNGMALSFEMRELETVLKYNKNNIQDYL